MDFCFWLTVQLHYTTDQLFNFILQLTYYSLYSLLKYFFSMIYCLSIGLSWFEHIKMGKAMLSLRLCPFLRGKLELYHQKASNPRTTILSSYSSPAIIDLRHLTYLSQSIPRITTSSTGVMHAETIMYSNLFPCCSQIFLKPASALRCWAFCHSSSAACSLL